MTLYELIKDGLDRDIVCFDTESNILSKRLICLMIQTAQRQNIDATTFYIDDIAKADLMSEICSIENWISPNITETIYGLSLFFVEGLDTSHQVHEFQSFYTKMGGTFPSPFQTPWLRKTKDSLIVLASKDKAILGCY